MNKNSKKSRSLFRKLIRLDLLLMFITLLLLTMHLYQYPQRLQQLIPENIFSLTLSMYFEPQEGGVKVRTYLPLANERQEVIEESIQADHLTFTDREEQQGRVAQWQGSQKSRSILYNSLVITQPVDFSLAADLPIPTTYDESLQGYLQATDAIPVKHPEIVALWQEIKPIANNVRDVLQAIYEYTYTQIKTVPFKGLTDSLTALRLGTASCNGKSRLFVSLARLNNLPARLVGGIILNSGSKKTSHQWVEVFIEDHWVPFGPTNGHFAKLPAHYLELYRGDQVLFGHSRDIAFDYLFKIRSEAVAPALYRADSQDKLNVASHLRNLGLTSKTTSLFLLFPLCTLIITFFRNMLGIKTFGIFMPMLISAACVFTGFWTGMLGFLAVLALAFAGHSLLEKFRLLKVPKLAAIITMNSIIFLGLLLLIDSRHKIEFGMLSLFPVIIITFIAERMHNMTETNDWKALLNTSLGTLVTIVFCYLSFNSILLQGVIALYPETLILLLALQLYIGLWSGIRISEVFRFKALLASSSRVLGINSRNRDWIYPLNDKTLLRLAADKLASKKALKGRNVPVPDTLLECVSYTELAGLESKLKAYSAFVVKPNMGSQGNGILVVTGVKQEHYQAANGKLYSFEEVEHLFKEILAGTYSQTGEPDMVFLEPLIEQHQSLQKLAPYGLSDIRIIVSQGQLISAMLRMPTKASSGKANLHQGAIGIAINMQSGITERAAIKAKSIDLHPDSQQSLLNVQIPFWSAIKELALNCQEAVPLGYLGVDVCLDKNLGPLVLEVNGRPGLEIQNIHDQGMADLLSQGPQYEK